MNKEKMNNVLASLKNVRVGVIGDFAIDIYFDFHKNTGELSVETGKPINYGSSISTHLGAASNVVNNLHVIGAKIISVYGIVGDDLLGRELVYLLEQKGICTDNLFVDKERWDTYTYIKPLEGSEEASRLDFGFSNELNESLLDSVLNGFEEKVKDLDVAIINQQFRNPLINGEAIERINRIIKENPGCKFFIDMRDNGEKIKGGVLNVNVDEIANILEIDEFDEKDTQLCIDKVRQVCNIIENPILMSRGENGLVYVDNGTVISEPGIYLTGEIDPVGAGDACTSAFSAAIGSGAEIKESMEIANLASAVAVKKFRQTGTASQEEISSLFDECFYNYNLGLAYDIRKAAYLEDSEIEIVEPLPENLVINNVILDHDGTISTLREGWEKIMYDVMMEQICGDKLKHLTNEEFKRLSNKCKKFIDDTTGIQTIVQMQGLRDMALEERYIESAEVKTAAEYKAVFLERLMLGVNERISRIENGERKVQDFIISGSIDFVNSLRDKGLTLFMASGTDEDGVRTDANALGYADLFNGGIYGSKGNEIGDAKKIVINKIISDGNCKGENLIVVGDGPVEIIEGRRAGALCIGIASDEIRRYGLNEKKRTRLIRAGAHIIIPDFSQLSKLLELIFGK